MQPLGLQSSVQAAQARRYLWHKAWALLLTAVSYGSMHAARKVLPVAKSVLAGPKADSAAAPSGSSTSGWPPFNGQAGSALLGNIDLAFFATYSVCLFFSGHLGDRLHLKYLLAAGLAGSGLFCGLFGMAYWLHIHSYAYFIVMSVCAGIFQSTGWPSVVSVVANWSGKGQRGLVMGLWATNMPLGNIAGTIIASALLSSGWGWSFIAPGLLLLCLAALVAVFLVVQPADVGLAAVQQSYTHVSSDDALELLPGSSGNHSSAHPMPPPSASKPPPATRFIDAVRIPGVATYALSLLFAKIIIYTFLTWLPYYIQNEPIGGRTLTPQESGSLSVLFDIGGLGGGILAGHLSDCSGAPATTTAVMLALTAPAIWLYRSFGAMSLAVNVVLMTLAGALIGGPQGLITTAVSADLGNHDESVQVQATVIAIIDGVGSAGSALGPMLTGILIQYGGSHRFDSVFILLELSAVAAALILTGLVAQEVRRLKQRA